MIRHIKAMMMTWATIVQYWREEIDDTGLYAGMNEARILIGRTPVPHEGLNYASCPRHGWQRAFAVPGLTGDTPICVECI